MLGKIIPADFHVFSFFSEGWRNHQPVYVNISTGSFYAKTLNSWWIRCQHQMSCILAHVCFFVYWEALEMMSQNCFFRGYSHIWAHKPMVSRWFPFNQSMNFKEIHAHQAVSRFAQISLIEISGALVFIKLKRRHPFLDNSWWACWHQKIVRDMALNRFK